MPDQLTSERVGERLTLTLNNTAKHNCIGIEMLTALQQALIVAEKDDRIRVIIIRGAGGKAFSSGGNIREFTSLHDNEIKRWIELGHMVFNRIEHLKKPTVAFIDGYALGGGLELALACDFRVGTENAVLSCPEVTKGWLPGWGGMVRLRRLIGEAQAKKMILLSTQVTAVEAISMGLLTRVFISEAESQLVDFAQRLSAIKPTIYALAKEAFIRKNPPTSDGDIQFDVQAVHIARK